VHPEAASFAWPCAVMKPGGLILGGATDRSTVADQRLGGEEYRPQSGRAHCHRDLRCDSRERRHQARCGAYRSGDARGGITAERRDRSAILELSYPRRHTMIAPGANPLLDHVWGISHAEDRIWAEVAGIAPSTRPWERLLMIWQAYIDDSETNQATSVLAGYIATAEVWANFTTKWEPLLPYTLPSKSTDKRRFKMSEMWNHNREMVPAFQNVIVNHIPFALSCKINISDLTRAKDRLLREVRDRLAPALRVDPTLSVKVPVFSDLLENQYIFCFYALMDKFHTYRSEQKDNEAFTRLIPPHQKIDFYFDKHS
jgi:hypothetical protein